MLLFKKKFLSAIRTGEKTQTVRLWTHRRMKPGQRSYVPGAGYIEIVAVDQVELADLTDDDARPDGFPTADALRAEIAAIYSQYADRGQKAFRVKFRLLPAAEQRKAAERNQPAKPSPRTSKRELPARMPQPAAPPINPLVRSKSLRIQLPADGFPISR